MIHERKINRSPNWATCCNKQQTCSKGDAGGAPAPCTKHFIVLIVIIPLVPSVTIPELDDSFPLYLPFLPLN